MENNNKAFLLLNTKFILGLAIIISTIIGTYAFYQIRSFDNTLTVTGSTSKPVTSDHVRWVGNISRVVKLSTLKEGYTSMTNDLATVQTFLKGKNIPVEQVITSAVSMEQNYDQNYSAEKSYTLRQTIEVNSSDVALITDIAKNINPIIEKGVIFSTQSLEYTYTKLPEERVSMLSDAIKDAKSRASSLASSSGKKVGQLKSASSGVVQVMSAGSTDVADYGMYDTSKIEKNIMMTVKASFTLK
jgi:uncharacterized protein